MFSLRTLIDDILLIVRNNNISESEDLSRDQIAAWVMAYKAYFAKKQQDKDKETGDDTDDDSLSTTIGPLELQDETTPDEDECYHRKRTKNKLPDLIGDSSDDISNVMDINGCIIQFMSEARKHFHKFRRYTYAEPACWYENGYLYVEGGDIDNIKTVYVEGNFVDADAEGEDEVVIPGWMIPDIKAAIMKNELSFMLNRPSDDSNNSTLASVKPHGAQDQEE